MEELSDSSTERHQDPSGPPDYTDWRGWLRWIADLDWTDPDTWKQFTVPWSSRLPAEAVPTGGLTVEWTAIAEVEPGPAFARHWARLADPLRRWWIKDGRSNGEHHRGEARAALSRHMPELVPLWERLVGLAGGSPDDATILALWNPPAFLTGCSQAVVRAGGPALIRNYDWDYRLFDATVANTGYLGRGVVGTEDCGWGLLDGVNDAGLAVSLTFGGRPQVGEGFGIPLVIRYVLQTCRDVDEAVAALRRVPVHMSYNVTATDPSGRAATVYVAPDRTARVDQARATTNHQGVVEWQPYCDAIRSEERLALLEERLERGDDLPAMTAAYLRDPLYATKFQHGFGTLYTAVIRPDDRSVTYHWPGRDSWTHSLDSPRAETTTVTLDRPSG